MGPAPDYTLSLAPTALTIGQGATGNTTVTITRTNFTGAVTLSLGSAPAGVTGSFSPAAPTGTSSTLTRSEEHTSELQSQSNIVCRLLLEKTTKNLSRI